MSLGLVIVGEEVGDMVGDVLSNSQSMADPGSKGGTHLLGDAVTVGAPLGGTVLGEPELVGAPEMEGWFDRDGTRDGCCETVGLALPVGVWVGVNETVGVEGVPEGVKVGLSEGTCGAAEGNNERIGAAVGVRVFVASNCNFLSFLESNRSTSSCSMSRNNIRSLTGGHGYTKTSSI